MKKTLTTHQIADELHSDKNAGWSWAGALALAEHFEEIEAGSGEEMELDCVAIRCDFGEHKSLTDWAIDYFGGESDALDALCLDPLDQGLSLDSIEYADDVIRVYINDRGTLIEFEGGVIVSSF